MSIVKRLLRGESAIKYIANVLDQLDLSEPERHEAKVERMKAKRQHGKTQKQTKPQKKAVSPRRKTSTTGARKKAPRKAKP